ncbi:hypothetical protein [Bacterioplanoides sp.]|uniref:hypothetical protein n=1 Tax=Bacterioplanoides sp. TaxID=2066072 RepID=UPI003B00A1C7
MYLEQLEELIALLRKTDSLASNWVQYFEKSKDLYLAGKVNDSYWHTLGSSGGMGSFDDDYWSYSLSKADQERHDYLKSNLRKLAKSNLNNK